MKLFFKNSLYFLIIASVSYIAILVLWGTFLPRTFHKNLRYGLSNGYLKERLCEADSTKNIDMLIIGSSHAFRGYDTRIFNENNIFAFNLGSSAQTPKQSLLLLQRYLHRMNPKLVLFDVYPEVFTLDGAESTLDLISNSRILDKKLIYLGLDTKNIKVYNTLVYSCFQKHFCFPKYYNYDNSINDGHYIKGGFVETIKMSKPKKNYVLNKITMLPSQLIAFNQILNLLNKNKIPVILVQSPIRRKFYKSTLNNKEVDHYFKSKAMYYNFNELINCDDDMFADERHLNQDGVKYFNSKLIKCVDFNKYFK